jgi:hypothetical protein
MVKIGFICEGLTDKLILKSVKFNLLLQSLGLECIDINDRGGRDKVKYKLSTFLQILLDKGAEKVVVIVDLDKDPCITHTKEWLTSYDSQITIIAVKEVESWLLADSETMSKFLEIDFEEQYPEAIQDPKRHLLKLCEPKFSPAIFNITKVFERIIDNGFNIENAATHPNCHSAQYFINKLSQIAQ